MPSVARTLLPFLSRQPDRFKSPRRTGPTREEGVNPESTRASVEEQKKGRQASLGTVFYYSTTGELKILNVAFYS